MESGGRLYDRFSNFECVNKDSGGADIADGGSLSVVFKATDEDTGEDVAFKFLDPDLPPSEFIYRYPSFQRESEHLSNLVGNQSHLQLCLPLNSFDLKVQGGSGPGANVPYHFIVTEWLEEDVLDYFMYQGRYSTLERLELFRSLVLAVSALHRQGIAHRDLKRDNFRLAQRGSRQVVVPIDLGTGVELDLMLQGPQINIYSRTPGAPAFAPIEFWCGLGNVREFGQTADMYALGTMLYGLFNSELFVKEQLKDSGFVVFQGVAFGFKAGLSNTMKKKDVVRDWTGLLNVHSRQVTVPNIIGPTSTIDLAAAAGAQKILDSLCSVDLSLIHI